MNYCERIIPKEIQILIKKELDANVQVERRRNKHKNEEYFWLQVVSHTNKIDFECLFYDFDVAPLTEMENGQLNKLKLLWNDFLASKFEDYKKAWHDYYFKNIDVDILKKDNTQEK